MKKAVIITIALFLAVCCAVTVNADENAATKTVQEFYKCIAAGSGDMIAGSLLTPDAVKRAGVNDEDEEDEEDEDDLANALALAEMVKEGDVKIAFKDMKFNTLEKGSDKVVLETKYSAEAQTEGDTHNFSGHDVFEVVKIDGKWLINTMTDKAE